MSTPYPSKPSPAVVSSVPAGPGKVKIPAFLENVAGSIAPSPTSDTKKPLQFFTTTPAKPTAAPFASKGSPLISTEPQPAPNPISSLKISPSVVTTPLPVQVPTTPPKIPTTVGPQKLTPSERGIPPSPNKSTPSSPQIFPTLTKQATASEPPALSSKPAPVSPAFKVLSPIQQLSNKPGSSVPLSPIITSSQSTPQSSNTSVPKLEPLKTMSTPSLVVAKSPKLVSSAAQVAPTSSSQAKSPAVPTFIDPGHTLMNANNCPRCNDYTSDQVHVGCCLDCRNYFWLDRAAIKYSKYDKSQGPLANDDSQNFWDFELHPINECIKDIVAEQSSAKKEELCKAREIYVGTVAKHLRQRIATESRRKEITSEDWARFLWKWIKLWITYDSAAINWDDSQRSPGLCLVGRREVCRGMSLLFISMYEATTEKNSAVYIRGWSPDPNPNTGNFDSPPDIQPKPNHGWNAYKDLDSEKWKVICIAQQRWSISTRRINQYYWAYDDVGLPECKKGLLQTIPQTWDVSYQDFKRGFLKYPWLASLGGVKCEEYSPATLDAIPQKDTTFTAKIAECGHRNKYPLLAILLRGKVDGLVTTKATKIMTFDEKSGWKITIASGDLNGLDEIRLVWLSRRITETEPEQIFGLSNDDFEKRTKEMRWQSGFLQKWAVES